MSSETFSACFAVGLFGPLPLWAAIVIWNAMRDAARDVMAE